MPNMVAVLLAQNTSKIVCVVLSDDISYEGKMIEDPFVAGMLNYLSKELVKNGYFMMLKEERSIKAVQLLKELIEGTTSGRQEMLQPKLIQRGSVKKIIQRKD